MRRFVALGVMLVGCLGPDSGSTTSTLEPTTTAVPRFTSTTSRPATSTTTTTIGTGTTADAMTTTPPKPEFRATIEDVTAERLAHSYKPDCPVTPADLVMISMLHWGFDGAVHDGQIVVARGQGPAVVAIFRRLFEARYPIEAVVPIGDLPEGVEDEDPDYNNTSGLHCRYVQGTTTWSEHARGLAIDINPLLNPYVTSKVIWPAGSDRYVDRTLGKPGMITSDDEVVRAFEDSGWLWGGYWDSIKDYQHFSVSGR